MSTTSPGTDVLATGGPTVLIGTPVVPGVALGPVVRPAGAVRLPAGDEPLLAEEGRAAATLTFQIAADAVAERLAARAAVATGVSAEVLSTTAGMARDRALRGAAEQRIDAGTLPAVAVVQAAQQFVELFLSLGG